MRCEVCGTPFEPRRRDRRFCGSRCRLRAMARKRAGELATLLTALDNLQAYVEAEIARWEGVAEGRTRGKGATDGVASRRTTDPGRCGISPQGTAP